MLKRLRGNGYHWPRRSWNRRNGIFHNRLVHVLPAGSVNRLAGRAPAPGQQTADEDADVCAEEDPDGQSLPEFH
jgi:hypothetical protein